MLNPHNDLLQKGYAKDSESDDFFKDVISEEMTKGYVNLSSNSVGIGIFLFNYSKKHECWYLKGLYRDGFLNYISSLGYSKRYRKDGLKSIIIKQTGNIIEEVTVEHLKDDVFHPDKVNTFTEIDLTIVDHVFKATSETLRETYLNNYHNILNQNFLEHLPIYRTPLLEDSDNETFICFQNVIVSVSKKGAEIMEYENLVDKCVWRNQIINRPYYEGISGKCHYADFIHNICANDPERIKSVMSATGYLINNYNGKSKGYAVLCYDEEITDLKNPQGGTGKGIFANAVSKMREAVKIDGKKFDPSDKFRWQMINDTTQVVWIDDAPQKLGFDVFHSVLTDGWNIEKKNKGEFHIRPEDSPKLLLTSNTVVQGGGNTNERRQFVIEFAPYYSNLQRNQKIKEPIKHIHGCIFFDDNDWDQSQWNLFYSFMIECSLEYHKGGCHYVEPKNVNRNKLIQSTCIDFAQWILENPPATNDRLISKDLFNLYKEYSGDETITQRTFNNWMKLYADIHKLVLEKSSSNSTSFITLKVMK